MPSYKINEHLELKLEGTNTNIYVNGKLFQQCKYILLDIPINDSEWYDELESIDEASEKLDHSMASGQYSHGISYKTEFWAHCSNLQVWAENNYDTRLVHSNLAFPLLEELYISGDKVAGRVFKEEVAKRYNSGYPPVREYLKENHYLNIFSDAELSALIENSDSIEERVKEERLNQALLEVGQSLKENRERKHSLKTKRKIDIIVLGDTRVGKRTLVDYLISGEYKEANLRHPRLTRIGLHVTHKYTFVDGNRYLCFFYMFVSSILEVPKFLHLFGSAQGIILVCDVTKKSSFTNVSRWVAFFQQIFRVYNIPPILLVGTKSDLENDRKVSRKEGEEMKERYNFLDYIECSVKERKSDNGIFETMTNEILNNMTEEEKVKSHHPPHPN